MASDAPGSCRARKRIPTDQWDAKRPIITKLYQEEKRPLKEVMDILEKEHGFTATVKMFKSRIWKWGLDKKLKSDEVLAILHLKRERDQYHKRTVYTIRDHPVDLDNINRYVKRNPSLMARFRAGQTPNRHTISEVRCHTPPPSPSPSLAAPPELGHTEEILILFKDYIDGSLSSGGWNLEYDFSCSSRSAGDRSDELLERVMTSFALVNRCMMRGDKINIGAILSPAFESLKEIVAAESPIFAVRTVCLLWYLDRHHKNDLLRLVTDYLGNLVPIVLGHGHAMTRIWRILGTSRFADYYELSLCLYSMLVPLLEHRVGAANYLMSILYGDHIDCLFHRKRSAESMAVVTRYRTKVEATGKKHPWVVELAITQTAIVCADKEAGGQISEAMACLRTLKSYDMSEDQEAVVNIQLGNYSFQMDDVPAAIRSYREATRLAMSVDGDERLLLTCLANLESALFKGCRTFEATRVQQYRLQRIADFANETSHFASQTRQPHGLEPTAPPYGGQLGLVYNHDEVPSWIWLDEPDFLNPPKQIAPSNEMHQLPWFELPSTPCGWTGSGTDSLTEASRSQYHSVSPLVAAWEDSPQELGEYDNII
ncbi:hypothetical protein S40285_00022 [Stachybotrys chlorohalonatus IBT 40285]|uniref:Clr5 domain-containing protein n=1 Tax=Stachybotrys chlorohalonatus (strain IBT 40285) TaxID=1283841 RepID=A0A084QYT9_STAC4|nr:hypothetical protein S40285_00022 [Stachybotrys chlorohalonata IBT 40285]